MSLIDKIRAARLTVVEIGKFKFTIKRPTDIERLTLKNSTHETLFKSFVVGWDNVKEIDIISGGTSIDVPFEPDLFVEWTADKPELWEPIFDALMDSMKRHDQARVALEKKPDNG
jgi:hypothetical protein